MKQKKLIAAVLAMVVALPVPALADTSNVNVYGAINLAFDVTDNGAVRSNQVSSQVSKIGLKGSEALTDGLKAVWQIEQQIDVDNTSAAGAKSTFATRNSFAGLSGESWGTLVLGRHDTPYKLATRKLDIFSDSLADNRSLMGQAGAHDARLTDTVIYTSPAMGGVTVLAAYVAGAETATLSTDTKGKAWSLAGMYDNGPLAASLAYQVFDYGSAGTGQFAGTANTRSKAYKLGGGYKMDALQVNAAYEKTSDNTGAGFTDSRGFKAYYLSGKYNLGNDAVKLAYTHASGLNKGTANTGANQLSVGYDHSLSKRTSVYALYTKLTNQAAATYKITNAGSTAGGIAVVAGNDPYAWSFGMKHSF